MVEFARFPASLCDWKEGPQALAAHMALFQVFLSCMQPTEMRFEKVCTDWNTNHLPTCCVVLIACECELPLRSLHYIWPWGSNPNPCFHRTHCEFGYEQHWSWGPLLFIGAWLWLQIQLWICIVTLSQFCVLFSKFLSPAISLCICISRLPNPSPFLLCAQSGDGVWWQGRLLPVRNEKWRAGHWYFGPPIFCVGWADCCTERKFSRT